MHAGLKPRGLGLIPSTPPRLISPTVEALVLGTSQYRFESDIRYMEIPKAWKQIFPRSYIEYHAPTDSMIILTLFYSNNQKNLCRTIVYGARFDKMSESDLLDALQIDMFLRLVELGIVTANKG